MALIQTFTPDQLENINESTKLIAHPMFKLENAIYTRSKDIINQPAKMYEIPEPIQQISPKTPLEKLSPVVTRLAEAVQKMSESPTTSKQVLIDIPEKTFQSQLGGSNVYELEEDEFSEDL